MMNAAKIYFWIPGDIVKAALHSIVKTTYGLYDPKSSPEKTTSQGRLACLA